MKLQDSQKKMLEILNDTVKYYGADPDNRRSMNTKGKCCYYNRGKMCAVGRLATNPKLMERRHAHETPFVFKDKFKEYGLPELPVIFYHDLQVLHDTSCHWDSNNKTGLTKEGISEAAIIRKNIVNGEYLGTAVEKQ